MGNLVKDLCIMVFLITHHLKYDKFMESFIKLMLKINPFSNEIKLIQNFIAGYYIHQLFLEANWRFKKLWLGWFKD